MLSLVLLCTSAMTTGASATVSDAFVVPLPVNSLAAWVARNPSAIAHAAGSQVVWRRGNEFQVSRKTPRGTVEATMRDDIRKIQGGYQYACRLVPGSSDELEAYSLDCTLTAAGPGKSLLSIRVRSTLTDSMRVRDWQLERSMRQSLERVRTLFEGLR